MLRSVNMLILNEYDDDNLQKTCRLLAAVVKNLYCCGVVLVRTAAIQRNFFVMLL